MLKGSKPRILYPVKIFFKTKATFQTNKNEICHLKTCTIQNVKGSSPCKGKCYQICNLDLHKEKKITRRGQYVGTYKIILVFIY